MLVQEYQRRSKRTFNTEGQSRKELLSNMAMGLSGESGEVVDLLKKHLYQGHQLDWSKAREEVGDLLWYVANLCNVLNIDMEDAMECNVEKLRKRYPDGFAVSDSVNREV